MNRQELVKALRIAAPGLASREVLPIYGCFCFSGGTVSACNDAVGIRTPVDVDFEGGVPGSLLLSWLSSSRAREVKADSEGSELTFRAGGRSRLKLSVLPPEDFIFKVQGTKKAVALPIKDAMLSAIGKVSIAMVPTGQGDAAWTTGVTLQIRKGVAYLYTGGNLQICRASWPCKGIADLEANIRTEFVQLLLSMRGLKPTTLYLTKKSVRADFEDGTVIQSANLAEPKASEYEAILSEIPELKACEIPKGFADAIDRALVVLQDADPGTKFRTDPEKGKLHLFSASSTATSRDAIPFDEDHPPVEVKAAAKLIKGALPHSTGIRFVDDFCVLLTGDKFLSVVTLIQQIVEEEPETGDDEE